MAEEPASFSSSREMPAQEREYFEGGAKVEGSEEGPKRRSSMQRGYGECRGQRCYIRIEEGGQACIPRSAAHCAPGLKLAPADVPSDFRQHTVR